MPGTIELDDSGQLLLIRFPYDERLVALVKGLPRRRWDPERKTWLVPASAADEVLRTLEPHRFVLGAALRARVQPDASAPVGRLPFVREPDPAPQPPPALTVSAINQRVLHALRGAFPDPIWVVGEVLDFDKGSGRQHRFFTLVEKVGNGPSAEIAARVEVALFEDTLEYLRAKLAQADPPLDLRDGIEIRVLARVDLFARSGRYQLVIDDIDPEYSLGKLALGRDQILREMTRLGLVERNAGLPLPLPPLRVAVLASESSDGWNDFARTVHASGLPFAITLFPVRVQGQATRATVLAGLRWFARRAADFDVVCILRGGGSRTDLSWFDDRELALAVARHPLKVLVGIGHERDRCVLDFLASSHKTPTAVGTALVAAAQGCIEQLRRLTDELLAATRDRLARARGDLARSVRALHLLTDGRLRGERGRMAEAASRLVRASRWTLLRRRDALPTLSQLHAGAGRLLARRRELLVTAGQRLRAGSMRLLEHRATGIERQQVRLQLLDPRRVLKRGYALVRRGGRIVPEAGALAAGDDLSVEFRDGSVNVTTRGVTMRPRSDDRQEP